MVYLQELCGDQDVVLTAVRQNGLALQPLSSVELSPKRDPTHGRLHTIAS